MIRIDALRKILKTPDRDWPLLSDINLTIPTGSFFTLLGSSASGKTTLLRVLAGLDSHDAGEISIADQLVSSPKRGVCLPTHQRDIGLVFQSSALWPTMSVYDNIAYPLTTGRSKVQSKNIQQEVLRVTELVGLMVHLKAAVSMLSGEQRYKVALARALIAKPALLLLDDPLGQLDPFLREHVRNELKNTQRKTQTTTLYIADDKAEALSMSDYVAVMNGGRIEMTGSPQDVYGRPNSALVAQSLGLCNFISGTVKQKIDSHHGIVQTQWGAVTVEMESLPSLNKKVTLMVRPESLIRVDGTNPNIPLATEALRIRGRILSSMYFGERQETDVLAGLQQIRFRHTPFNAREGRDITLALRNDRCWAIADQAP